MKNKTKRMSVDLVWEFGDAYIQNWMNLVEELEELEIEDPDEDIRDFVSLGAEVPPRRESEAPDIGRGGALGKWTSPERFSSIKIESSEYSGVKTCSFYPCGRRVRRKDPAP